MHRNQCVISCIFGKKFRKVYRAPNNVKAYFFTNNTDIKDEIERKGWRYIYVRETLSEDLAISSLQAKYVKYLQFLDDPSYSDLKVHDEIIYVDHKFELTETHVERLNKLRDRPVLIRKTPRTKTSVWDEIEDAKGQERYLRFMPQTLEYVQRKLAEGYSERMRVCNTGLICYAAHDHEVSRLVEQVNRDLLEVGTSECQIIWSMVSQRFSSIIQMIEWTDLPILWKTPES